jgi:ABC-type iron transport system FetAB permease component
MCSFCAEYCFVVSLIGSILMFMMMIIVASETIYFPATYELDSKRNQSILTLFFASLVTITIKTLYHSFMY